MTDCRSLVVIHDNLSPADISCNTDGRKLFFLMLLQTWVVVSNIFIFFYFHPYLGKIPILTHIFQMGWFNHQLETIWVEQGCWFNNRTWTEIPSGAAEATSSQSGDRVTRSKGWGIYGFSGRGESVWKFYEFVKIWWNMRMLFGCCFLKMEILFTIFDHLYTLTTISDVTFAIPGTAAVLALVLQAARDPIQLDTT